ncbi:Gfo/Idh/MocA family protein [Pedobacter montanisoli]|uniref:Gfo/Idh/MocA family oxidoreductase n=1 Tax=Pedobacter montanisoli TaxID=2923277 RepID=A0ABS9ZSE5_9SPHI|nr:Gfo/Idh/MocA family oxidoreductase [Pedobacter montanisoli]MCJ0741514.1 Gfo/Idh/MocA family oxidoreductase [Pedobacter montanisoli]
MKRYKKIKFAILGYGHIGKRHTDLIVQDPNAELVAVIDIDPFHQENALELKVPLFTNLSEFLNAGIYTDVVNICTPNGLHANQAIECLESHKHVIIEKPIALTKQEALNVQKASIKHRRYAFPVVQNRYSSAIKWVKEILEKQALGEIFMVQLNCFWNRDERYYIPGSWHGSINLDGGPLYTQFSHFIDVLLWMFGDIINISSKFLNFNHEYLTQFEDSGIISFDFKKQGVGILNYSTSIFGANFESSMTIIGAKGVIKIGGQYMNEISYCNVEELEVPSFDSAVPPNNYGAYQGSAANHQFLISNVINVLNGIETPHVNLEDGIRVVDTIERIYTGRIQKEKIGVTNDGFTLYN